MSEPYYLAYERRYRKVYEAGIARWGHMPDDKLLSETLAKWVEEHGLRGKQVIEFACGEGASGVILSELGCAYHGVDIAPSAVEKARELLAPYPDAAVSLLDMVNDPIPGSYDAALDCMGFHMLVLDCDRQKYLRNAFESLKPGAPMLFFRQCYRVDAYTGTVESFEQWQAISGSDYTTPQLRGAMHNGINIEVAIPLVPARARNKEDYIQEFTDAGFIVDDFIEMDSSEQINYSATIFAHKPTTPSLRATPPRRGMIGLYE